MERINRTEEARTQLGVIPNTAEDAKPKTIASDAITETTAIIDIFIIDAIISSSL